MKVLQVHFWGDAANVTGSVEKVIDSFARLDDADIELAIASRAATLGSARRHGKVFHTFIESRWRNRLYNKLLGLKAFTFPSLVKLIEEVRPDILHIHNRPELVDRLVARLSWRPKVICHYHRRFGTFVVPACADLLVAVSDAIRQALQSATGTSKHIVVIYNPVPVFVEQTVAAPPPPPLCLLYAGGRQAHKGFYELIEAIAPFAGRESLVFELCGPKLDGYVPPTANVKNLGMLDHEAFQQHLAGAHVVLMPSHFEGFSLLVLEAMTAGKLMIATRGGGMAEIVDTDCALVPVIGEATSLSRCIGEAIELFLPQNGNRLKALTNRARQKVARFSAARINQDLAQCYRSLFNA